MKIISFGKTTPALLAGAKTVTRREWAEKHARSFAAGELVQAWNHSPRVKGAKRVGTIRLLEAPFLQSTAGLPASEYEAEGFVYMFQHDLSIDGMTPPEFWNRWKSEPRELWVVRFELVSRAEVVS